MTQTLEPRVRVAPARRGRRRPWWLLALAVPVGALLIYMLSAYLPPDMSTSRVPVKGDPLHYVLLVGHIGFATIATVTGLAQFWPWLRRTHPKAHRWTGRVYFFGGIFPSMILAVPVAGMSTFGFANMAGLFTLLALWAITGIAGWRAVRARRYADHRNWMIRNYAITLASLASRPWQIIMALIIVSQASSPIYHGDSLTINHDIASSSVWLGIVVNIVIAECWIIHRYGKRAGRAQRVAAPPVAADSARREMTAAGTGGGA